MKNVPFVLQKKNHMDFLANPICFFRYVEEIQDHSLRKKSKSQFKSECNPENMFPAP